MLGPVLAILVVSAFMHAGWNLLAKRRQSDAPRFMLRMYLIIAAAGLIPAGACEWAMGPMPAKAWFCTAVSGVFSAFYSLGLAKGYASADFTVVYPVARALPVMIVALGDVAFGRYPTGGGWAGMSLVTVGCFLAPLHSLREFHPSVYFHRSTAWMLLAALGTVGYTLTDKLAMGFLSTGPVSALRYGYAYFAFTGVFYALLWSLFARHDSTHEKPEWRIGALGALMIFGGYALILWVYQLMERASYVLAFRQLSIVIGVLFAFHIYREKGKAVRLTAAGLIGLGLVVIGVWGHAVAPG